jgi:hypothetical protein
MLKYVSKFVLDILPSVIATVVGAYIVNHYIVPKPAADAARSAAISKVDSTQPPKAATANLTTAPDPAPAREAAPREVKSKTTDKAPKASPDKSSSDKTQADKAGIDRSPEPAKTEPESRRLTTRDKPVDKAQPAATPAETAAVAPDDHPNAAELARAALVRLRATEPARSPEATASIPSPAAAPVAHEPSRDAALIDPRPTTVPPLPPAVSVAAPPERGIAASDPAGEGSRTWRSTEADHVVPPADIPPSSAPIDLQPVAAPPARKKSVTEDVLSAARSVFQSVVPQ